MPKVNSSSPDSSTRTCIFICRSWARFPRILTKRAVRRRSWAARRRLSRCVARLARTMRSPASSFGLNKRPRNPPAVEAEGVHHLMTFVELTGAATYIVHLSCREALNEAIAARQRGVRVSVETLIQYLTLDKTYAEKPKFEGSKYVMSPPLRDKR